MRKTSCVLFEQDVGFVAILSLYRNNDWGSSQMPTSHSTLRHEHFRSSTYHPHPRLIASKYIGKCRRTSLSPEPAKIRYLSIFFVRRPEVVAGRTLMLCAIRLLASFEWPIVSNGSCKLRSVFRGFEYQLSSNLRYMITGCRDKSKFGVWRMIRQWPIKLLSFINNRPFGRPVLYI